ncbi:hypothetical protein Tco_1164842 [Tanacetum coccineum]
MDAINHMMSFLTSAITSRFPTTSNQLRNLSNPRQQAPINDGRVNLQPVQGRQVSFALGTTRNYTPRTSGINSMKQRVVIFLHEEELALLADLGVLEFQNTQTIITHNAAYQADDLDAYDSDCDELNNAQVALMANFSRFGSDALSEINLNNKSVNDTLTTELERYKEQIKVLKDGQNVEITSKDKFSDSHEQNAEIDRVKPSTSASGSQPSGNTKKDKIQRPPNNTQKNKVETNPGNVKSSLKNKKYVVEPQGTVNVQHSKLNANSELICVKCNGYMLSDNHDLCVLNSINDVRAKYKSIKKISNRKVWKPTGKVFTNIGYTWRPTSRTFTIVGNEFPLTRITTTTEVPPRKPIALEIDTPKPVVTLVYSRKPMKPKTTDLVVQIVLWNVTISRVYYVEGLGHNLFSIRSSLPLACVKNRPTFYNDDDEYTVIYRKPKVITPDLPIEEPDNSLSIGDEHLNTIPETEKTSVENLVPIPSEFKGISEDICDVPSCDHFDAECGLINSLLSQDSSITSPKIDFIPEEFVGKLDFINLILLGIDEDDFDKEDFDKEDFDKEEGENDNDILQIEDDILLVDSDVLVEEVDTFLVLEDSIPSGIESDLDSEGDIVFLENILNEDPILEGGKIDVSQNVEDDDSLTFVIRTFLPFLTYLVDSPLLLSTRSEDTIFDPDISI